LDLQIINITKIKAKVVFTTDELAVSYLQYGLLGDYTFQTIPEDSYFEGHEFVLESLVPGRKYNFTVHLYDTKKNAGETKSYYFTTLPDIKTIFNVSGFTAVQKQDKVLLSWKLPDMENFSKVRLVRKDSSYPINDTDGLDIYSGLDTYFEDDLVDIGNTYYYSIFVYDKYNNKSSGSLVNIKVKDSSVEPMVETTLAVEVIPVDLEEEVLDEDIFENLVPATLIEVPSGATLVVEEEKSMPSGFINLFSLFKQRAIEGLDSIVGGVIESYKLINNGFGEVVDYFANIDTETKIKLQEVKPDIFDKKGNLNEEAIKNISAEVKKQIEEIISKPLPPVFERDSIAVISPLDWQTEKTKEYGADWHIFADSDALLSISRDMFAKDVLSIIVTLKKEAYIMDYNEDANNYETIIKAPEDKGKYQMLIQVIYTDNTYEELDKSVLVDPYGYVFYKDYKDFSWKNPVQFLVKEIKKVRGAKLSLYYLNRVDEWVLWPANLYNQLNPQGSGIDGGFAFVVPAGKYYLEASGENLRDYKSDVLVVEDEAINFNLKMVKKWEAKEYVLFMFLPISVIILLALFILKKRV